MRVSSFCERGGGAGAFIVHDDQAGPYKVIPSTPRSAKASGFVNDDTIEVTTRSGLEVFNIEDHGVFAMALMPIRAFSTARAAEVTAQRPA